MGIDQRVVERPPRSQIAESRRFRGLPGSARRCDSTVKCRLAPSASRDAPSIPALRTPLKPRRLTRIAGPHHRQRCAPILENRGHKCSNSRVWSPDSQGLLSLQPEELAGKILFILRKRNDKSINALQAFRLTLKRRRSKVSFAAQYPGPHVPLSTLRRCPSGTPSG